MRTKICKCIILENGKPTPEDGFAQQIKALDVTIIKPEYVKDGNGVIIGTINNAQGSPILWYWSKGDQSDFDTAPSTFVEPRKTFGKTAKRPTGMTGEDIGFRYFDTEIDKPIWWAGQKWKLADGTNA